VTTALLEETYAGLADVLHTVDEDASWLPTGCRGWAVRDLTHHCLGDAQRALVALHRPTSEAVDRDAVGYWGDWSPDPEAAAQGRRWTRVSASMFLHWEQLRETYLETSEAVRAAARLAPADLRVRTQGHVLTASDLCSTLAVEATLHHLDLVERLPGRTVPSAAGWAEVRRVLDGLLGSSVAPGWSDERLARVATGRAAPDAAEAAELGEVLDRLPVFC
jgi:hypothetical protein